MSRYLVALRRFSFTRASSVRRVPRAEALPPPGARRSSERATRGGVLGVFVLALTLVTVACSSPEATNSASFQDDEADVGSAREAVSTTSVTNAADELRTGWYSNQPALSPATVGGSTFGQLFAASVDGAVYAQPLFSQGTVFVVTENNSIYGLDPETGANRWTPRNLGTPFHASDIGCADLTPNIGITGTPVIDSSTNVAYFFSKAYVSGSSGAVAWYAHAVNVATGAEQSGFPVLIQGTAANEPSTSFNAYYQMQRPGLLLMNGVVYAAFAGHCDIGQYQGWIVGVRTNGQIATLWTTQAGPNRTVGAGIWQSGGGLVSDGSGRIFFATGNGGAPRGPIGGKSPPGNLGEALVHADVQADGTLKATDFFVPYNAQSTLDPADADFGSGGPMAFPSTFGTAAHPKLLTVAGKEGYIYLLDRDNLGGVGNGPNGSDNVIARLGPYSGVWGKPALWGGDGGYVYYVPSYSPLLAFKYGVSGSGDPTLVQSGKTSDSFGYTSGSPIVTSDGSTSGTALVWTIWSSGSSGSGGQLRAYDAVPNASGNMVLRFSAATGVASKFAMPGVGNGRIYVGSRDGKLFGFGAPVSSALTAPATNFGSVVVGSSSTKTVTITAQKAVTVQSLSVSAAQFTLGTPSRSLPAALNAGDSLSVPVTFKPSAATTYGATLDVSTAASGVASFSLSGSGLAATAQLGASPGVVSFGGVAVGGNVTRTVTLSNSGAQALTFQSFTLPRAPFTASGLPAVGSSLAAGASISFSVSFSPTALGSFTDAVGVTSTGGNVSVPLSGDAQSVGSLVITPLSLDAGDVAIGGARALSFSISNTGGSTVTITKSKPPVLGPFTATTTLNEGTKVPPGTTLIETVVFSPTTVGPSSDVWVINGDDASGLQNVKFTGYGVTGVPGFADTRWTLNGNATRVGSTIQLTPATDNQVGSTFWPTAYASDGLTVSFDALQTDGTGADGLALILADASAGATATSLGAAGGGLGVAGIPGVTVALDTYQNDPDPSSNFVGLATSGTASGFVWAQTNTAVPTLRGSVRHVTVTVRSGTVNVYLDGSLVITKAVAVASRVLVGFGAGTGGLTDRHVVSNVSITGFGAHVNFQAAGASLYPPYLVDDGSAFGARNGLSYGWSGNNRDAARTRGASNSPDPRYDSLVHMQKDTLPNASWELSVPNGTYDVSLVSGDPQHFDSVYRVNVEGTLAVSGTPSSSVLWFSGSVRVNVTDGKLTISNASGSTNNKICFVDVTAAM